MRTLKKTLSLVLVVAMVLGLCVVGASATNKVDGYEDAGKIGAAYTEAVGVMTGLGIVDGVTDTELRPENTYQRDQAAKIIAYMLLGKNKADSLSCTVAPFEDVPANHWAAGYIAFCKEQGIIDGVTETTFNPTGTLTGFQWAKMLLCAVGFGVNGEFEGDSWSLNTSKVAHTVDLFAGDLAGADHVALQRQQAMLYAFNALTNVDVVVYSAALGDYIEWYSGFIGGRFTYTGTLGENVYSLYNVTGTITDNEAMGNGTTVVDPLTGDDVKVAAKTGLDMMWHVAKVWYVKGSSNTGVYVKDLATVKNSSCGEMAKTPTGYTDKTIGTGTPYEKSIVDNPAGYTDYAVTTYAYLAPLGYASTAGKTTYIGTENVKNEYIKTDISAITSTVTPNVVIKASTKAYHVFATTATSGAVAKVTKTSNGYYTITLSDGTEIKESSLTYNKGERTNLIADLESNKHVKPVYYFLLDTHGDYVYLSQEQFQTVAYFTGAKAYTGGTNDWWPDATYKAQFVDIETGEIEEIPVTSDWVKNAQYTKGYYDITDELYGEKTYEPKPVFTRGDTTYGLKYGYADKETFNINTTGTDRVMTVGEESVYYDDTVVFYIANYNGSKLVVDKYVGVTGLVEGYAAKHNTDVSAVTLKNAAITYTKSAAGNMVAVTVFAYDTAVARGGYIFFPKDVNGWSSVSDNNMAVTGYKNGTAETETAKFTKTYFEDTLKSTLRRGFYTYTVNEAGYYKVTRLENDNQKFVYDRTKLAVTEINGATYFNNDAVASDCKVVDTRTVADNVDKIVSVDQIIKCNNWSGVDPYGPFAIAYVVQNKQISTIYVVEFNLGAVKASLDTGLAGDFSISDAALFEDEDLVITGDPVNALDVGTTVKVAVSYTKDGSASATKTVDGTVAALADTTKKIVVDLNDILGAGYKNATVKVTAIDMKVTIVNNTKFSVALSKTNGQYEPSTTEITVPVATPGFSIELTKAAANGMTAEIALTGVVTEKVSQAFTTGHDWVEVVPTTNEVEIVSITAKVTFTLADGNKERWNLGNNNYSTDAEYDSCVVKVEPGEACTVTLQLSTGFDGGIDHNNWHVTLNGIVSNETYNHADNSHSTFTFNMTPTSNTVTATVGWSE